MENITCRIISTGTNITVFVSNEIKVIEHDYIQTGTDMRALFITKFSAKLLFGGNIYLV